jgi:predicted PurR-regulated permease PerM
MNSAEDRAFFTRALETSIRIGLLLFLVLYCFQIARPFLPPILWGIILAVATQPIHAALCRVTGGRSSLAATILVVGALLVLIVPSTLLTTNLVDSATSLAKAVDAGTLEVPPPPPGVADWPFVGEQVHAFWAAASRNLDTALDPLLIFALSIVIAGVLLASSGTAVGAAQRIAERLVPDRGGELVHLAHGTVQSVTRGILGTAFIQAFLASLGMILVGVPAFGLWALLILLLAVVQLPTLLVLAPIIVWVFASSSTGVAVLFAIWSVAVGLSDNVLKPLLLGRGSDVPMAVIFIGAIGGFMLEGIIGLFVGAVVLSVGYTLFQRWLEPAPDAALG